MSQRPTGRAVLEPRQDEAHARVRALSMNPAPEPLRIMSGPMLKGRSSVHIVTYTPRLTRRHTSPKSRQTLTVCPMAIFLLGQSKYSNYILSLTCGDISQARRVMHQSQDQATVDHQPGISLGREKKIETSTNESIPKQGKHVCPHSALPAVYVDANNAQDTQVAVGETVPGGSPCDNGARASSLECVDGLARLRVADLESRAWAGSAAAHLVRHCS